MRQLRAIWRAIWRAIGRRGNTTGSARSAARRPGFRAVRRVPSRGASGTDSMTNPTCRVRCTETSLGIEFLHPSLRSNHVFPWKDVFGAIASPSVAPGLILALKSPPYTKYVPANSDGWQTFLTALRNRKLGTWNEQRKRTYKKYLKDELRSVITGSFPPDKINAVNAILGSCHEKDARTQLAILQLGDGDVDKLRAWVDRANADSRDVLSAAWRT